MVPVYIPVREKHKEKAIDTRKTHIFCMNLRRCVRNCPEAEQQGDLYEMIKDNTGLSRFYCLIEPALCNRMFPGRIQSFSPASKAALHLDGNLLVVQMPLRAEISDGRVQ